MADRPSPSVLDAIVGATRHVVEARKRTTPADTLRSSIADRRAPVRSLSRALRTAPQPRIIAECKRRSPSRGILRADYDPAAIAADYQAAGAAAISVLTEPSFFDGSPDHLRAVRASVSIPVLRKDFVVDSYQVLEAAAWGADAVLLIVAALDDEGLRERLEESAHLGLDALVEVHDATELRRALEAGAAIVGVNNRNLKTLDVSLRTAEMLAAEIPDGILAVAESGLKSAADLDRLSAAGYDGFLMGERFMAAENPGRALQEMRSCRCA